jgi:hypothetical protein
MPVVIGKINTHKGIVQEDEQLFESEDPIEIVVVEI